MTLDEAYRAAVQHHLAGRVQQAEQLYRQILSAVPDQPQTLHMLGVLAYSVGRAEVAVELIGRAGNFNPSIAGVWNNLGEAQRAMGRFDEAMQSYRRAIEQEPRAAEPHNNLGLALQAIGRIDEAIESFRRAIAIRGDFGSCISNLGNALAARGDTAAGIDEYRRAVAIDPGYAPAHNNLGAALEAQDDLIGAEAAYRRAVEVSRHFAEAWNNLGSAIRKLARFDEAKTCFERALSIDPNHAGAAWNLGLIRLTFGDYARGWDGYEQRWRVPALPRPRGFAQPMWDGSPLGGRTILVHFEQGYGDAIMAARFLPLAAQRGGRVIVEMPDALVELMRGVDGVAGVVRMNEPLPPFDVYAPIMSLPRVFHTRVETIPADVPYLRADADRVEQFARKLAGLATPRVGIVWAGKAVPDPLRSIDPSLLVRLADFDVRWVSLQVGEAAASSLPRELNAFDLSANLHDFADTAAAMMNLDLVVTIDTAAAHMAGALGRRTWALVPFSPDWRWMTDRDDSPWYPTMRLFRQTQRGDWSAAIDRVAAALGGMAW